MHELISLCVCSFVGCGYRPCGTCDDMCIFVHMGSYCLCEHARLLASNMKSIVRPLSYDNGSLYLWLRLLFWTFICRLMLTSSSVIFLKILYLSLFILVHSTGYCWRGRGSFFLSSRFWIWGNVSFKLSNVCHLSSFCIPYSFLPWRLFSICYWFWNLVVVWRISLSCNQMVQSEFLMEWLIMWEEGKPNSWTRS